MIAMPLQHEYQHDHSAPFFHIRYMITILLNYLVLKLGDNISLTLSSFRKIAYGLIMGGAPAPFIGAPKLSRPNFQPLGQVASQQWFGKKCQKQGVCHQNRWPIEYDNGIALNRYLPGRYINKGLEDWT
jgi:hypothetical protein